MDVLEDKESVLKKYKKLFLKYLELLSDTPYVGDKMVPPSNIEVIKNIKGTNLISATWKNMPEGTETGDEGILYSPEDTRIYVSIAISKLDNMRI